MTIAFRDEALKAASSGYSSFQKREQANCHDVAEIVALLCSDTGRFISQSLIRLPMILRSHKE